MHEETSKQRNAFRNLLLQEWPDLTNTELSVLETSFYFEPEAHKQLWDDLPIVWLDEGRILEIQENEFAKRRVNTYKSWLSRAPLHNYLDKISKKAWQLADQNCVDLNRSHDFFIRIFNTMKNSNKKWAFVIVGAGHTDEFRNGTMANLLAKQEEIFFQRHVLR